MKTLSLTEFNQNPSRATRLADEDEVLVLRRGVAAYRLVRVDPPEDPVDALVQAGLATPAKASATRAPLPRVRTDLDVTAILDADRNRLG